LVQLCSFPQHSTPSSDPVQEILKYCEADQVGLKPGRDKQAENRTEDDDKKVAAKVDDSDDSDDEAPAPRSPPGKSATKRSSALPASFSDSDSDEISDDAVKNVVIKTFDDLFGPDVSGGGSSLSPGKVVFNRDDSDASDTEVR
jgi:hypothetical protein